MIETCADPRVGDAEAPVRAAEPLVLHPRSGLVIGALLLIILITVIAIGVQ
ncbi:hypothetical protein GCM10027289_21350 [Tsukamurella serpentis]